jgi:hypothetical protein
MPWTPSLSFPHPLANIQPTSASPQTSNLLSFHLVEMLTWQGLGDIINQFRVETLGLEPISSLFAPGLTWRLKIPFTYAWSPSLLARPREWGGHVNISGYFTDPTSAGHDDVEEELVHFLEKGEPPVYIGFGSIKFDNSAEVTHTILSAVERLGIRAIVSRGWAKLGDSVHPDDISENVLFVDDTPHPWLFPKCAAVVHHGGAGTTAAGLSMGKPTVVVPFFGDQWFWGDMVARRGAGPKPIPFKQLTVEKLTDAIGFALQPSCREAAQQIAAGMEAERGCEAGAGFFHAALRSGLGGVEREANRCAVCPERIACWRLRLRDPNSRSGKKSKSKSKSRSFQASPADDSNAPGDQFVKLSALAAYVLTTHNLIDPADLSILRTMEYDTSKVNVPWDPVTSLLANTGTTVSNVLLGVAAGPIEAYKQVNASKERERARQRMITQGAEGSMQSSWDSRTLSNDTVSLKSQDTGLTKDSTSKLYDQSTGSSTITRKPLSASSSSSQLPQRPPNPPRSGSGMEAAGAIALESTKGIGRIMTAGLKTPATFTNGLARGFHNVPTLYGDETVRPEEKITGVKSGLVAAGKGFGYGLYDGLTGLVTQPYNGAKKEGALGFVKGFGKGLGGVVFKPSAGACGVPGYAFMGVYKSISNIGKGKGKATVEQFLEAARFAQGEEESRVLEGRDVQDIVAGWQVVEAQRGLADLGLERQNTGGRMSERSFRSEKKNEKGNLKGWEEYDDDDNNVGRNQHPALRRNDTGASAASTLRAQETGVTGSSNGRLAHQQTGASGWSEASESSKKSWRDV